MFRTSAVRVVLLFCLVTSVWVAAPPDAAANTVPLSAPTSLRTWPEGAKSVYAADLDGDGDVDVLGGASIADDVLWWENDDLSGPGTGDGSSWTQRMIDENFNGASSVEAADIDGDGDLDVVGAGYSGTGVCWWENEDVSSPGSGNAGSWTKHVVGASSYGSSSAHAADIDGDGDLDIIAGTSGVVWWENNDIAGPGSGDGTSWSQTTMGGSTFTVVSPADVDGDGDLDVLAGVFGSDDVIWWENNDTSGPGTGDGSSWTDHAVDGDFDGASTVFGVDLDSDGDLDVLAGAKFADEVTWWENVDISGSGSGVGATWIEHVIDGSVDGVTSVFATDIDGDGDPDVLAAASSDNDISWWENDGTAGAGTGNASAWTEHSIAGSFQGAWSAFAADLDGDGDLEVMGAAYSAAEFSWWENDGNPGSGVPWTKQVLASRLSAVTSITAADIDGDGDLDALGVATWSDAVLWWENDDVSAPGTGDASSWTEHLVDGSVAGAWSAQATDLDGDGDLDVLGSAYSGQEVAWWENEDVLGPGTGNGGTWTKHSIDLFFTSPREVRAADVDGDGDLDVVGAASITRGLVWWENQDVSGPGTGDGGAWTKVIIDWGPYSAWGLDTADVDGDGDVDVLVAAQALDAVRWFENIDVTGPGSGDGSAWGLHTIDFSFDGPRSVRAADGDGDGDIDVFATAWDGDVISWWENDDLGGNGSTWTEHSIANVNAPSSVHPTDFDADGDMDVLAVTYPSGVSWWENLDVTTAGTGDGTSWSENPIDPTLWSPRSVFTADMDGDGDQDVLATSVYDGSVFFWENLSSPPIADAGPAGGGSYVGDEATAVVLDGSGSSDDTAILEWNWDCDGDGSYELTATVGTGSSCTFADDGTYTVGLQVSDDLQSTATATATVVVANVAPTITSAAGAAATEDTEWTYEPAATDPAGLADPLVWSIDANAPGSMSIEPTTGAMSWTPTYADVGSRPITLSVDDGDGGTDSESFTILVAFTDSDGDGLADTWETAVGLDPTLDNSTLDGDADGLSNLDEFLGGTDPNSYDGPDVPVALAPMDGVEVDDATPNLSWEDATDPNGDPLTYDVEVFADASMGDLLTSTTGFPQADDGTGTTSWTVDAELPDNANMSWRVRAADPYATGGWSDLEEAFVNTANDAPEAVSPLAPLAGQVVDVLRPVLSWAEGVDIDRDLLLYDVQVLTDDGETVLAAEVGLDTPALDEGWTVDVDLTEDGRFGWTVRAVDEHGLEGPWSDLAEFSVSMKNTAPGPTELIAPADESAVEGVAPVLTATESIDPEGDILTYVFELDTESSFESSAAIAIAIAETGGEVSWDLQADGLELEEDLEWFARVRAQDEGGAASAWDTISFFVRGNNDPPAVPFLLSPDDRQETTEGLAFAISHAPDPEGDAVSYDFLLTTDLALTEVVEEVFQVPPSAGPLATADQTSWRSSGPIEGTLYWSARAVDERGASSEWAAPRLLTGSGCACASAGPSPKGTYALLVPALLLLRRRRWS